MNSPNFAADDRIDALAHLFDGANDAGATPIVVVGFIASRVVAALPVLDASLAHAQTKRVHA